MSEALNLKFNKIVLSKDNTPTYLCKKPDQRLACKPRIEQAVSKDMIKTRLIIKLFKLVCTPYDKQWNYNLGYHCTLKHTKNVDCVKPGYANHCRDIEINPIKKWKLFYRWLKWHTFYEYYSKNKEVPYQYAVRNPRTINRQSPLHRSVSLEIAHGCKI